MCLFLCVCVCVTIVYVCGWAEDGLDSEEPHQLTREIHSLTDTIKELHEEADRVKAEKGRNLKEQQLISFSAKQAGD